MEFKVDSRQVYKSFLIIIIVALALAIVSVFFMVTYEILRNSGLLRLGKVTEIATVPCVKTSFQEGLVEKKSKSITSKNESIELCLPVIEVMGLNNSIKLAESISLLGIFVAIVGIMLPIIGFITIKHERISIENKLEKKFSVLKNSIHQDFLQKKKELSTNIVDSINKFPHNIIGASKFRQAYLIHKLKEKSEEYDINQQGNIEIKSSINHPIRYINRIFAAAYRLESALINICYADDTEVRRSFELIENHIASEDVLTNKRYIKELKQILRQFHLNGAFNSDGKRKALNDFLEGKLQTDPVQWFREIETK